MEMQIWVFIGAGNGSFPEGTRPITELLFTSRRWGCVSVTIYTAYISARILIFCRPGLGLSYIPPDIFIMMTSSNGSISALLAICAGNSPITGEFPSQRPVTWSFDVLFDLRLNKRLSKQWGSWWLETPSRSSWRHCNVHEGRRELVRKQRG